ncbi:HAD family phosphatase [Maritimibacter sp. HL-12]|uniref:HAD family hydrolase n=1 Tax=Maritimibacter sp. HL-12 TaxID=1162418 RepID=UPI000A0F31DA|nr:HAD family phosphatase [Maritimibacter sp. HL-12]SMH47838.1 haloacid dehalogenase superfamily, subfamily IA, variant 3 with third motif having DD or ED [Maritimibacter sp. HL-12]
MTPKAVLFDCDGVLVDSEPLGLALLQDDLADHGLLITMAEIETRLVGMTMPRVAEKARGLGADLPADWVDQHYLRLYPRLAEGTPLIPGVEALLDRLDAAGIVYAVGSNGARRKMEITLSQHPRVWSRLKDHLHSGQELERPKPDPALYLHAAAGLGVAPADCVVVEDSAPGCRAGVAAGMRTFGFAPTGGGAKLAAEGAEVFHDMADLPALLGL